MAEEMIVAVDLKKQCEECRQSCEEYDGFYADCDQCPFAEKAIKRTEAIKRMAKAMYVASWKRRTPLVRVTSRENGFADNMKKKYLLAAEAALDALLKGE